MIHLDYAPIFEREQPYELSPAGKFWFAYMLGANSFMGALLLYAYADAIRQAVGL